MLLVFVLGDKKVYYKVREALLVRLDCVLYMLKSWSCLLGIFCVKFVSVTGEI
jgi:hypothetical protein